MTKKQRKTLCRIVIAAALYALAVAAPLEGMLRLAAFLAVYAQGGAQHHARAGF